ncbi:MAG TPA: biopolymer transporter ExbD [Flavisolibacter sp.]|jgi:biopolymer transport protein ExbD|nr:biopolymer transporter ExbD [Flavisolibacter sp.]
MTTAQPQPTGIRNRKMHSLKIDMTPLVDLGFLLITFFIFTSALSEPTVTRLIMPKEGDEAPVPQSKALTLVLDNNKVFVYEGTWDEAIAGKRITQTTYSLQRGMGELVRQKQTSVGDDLVVLIKPLHTSSYQNVLTALDEMQINKVKKYAIVEATADERLWVEKQ